MCRNRGEEFLVFFLPFKSRPYVGKQTFLSVARKMDLEEAIYARPYI